MPELGLLPPHRKVAGFPPKVGAACLVVVSLCLFAEASAKPVKPPPTATARQERTGFDSANTKLVAPPRNSLQQLAGRTIRGISIKVLGTRWRKATLPRKLKDGQALTADGVRKALNELMATGQFAQAHADARPFQDGVIVRFTVLPRRLLADLQVTGSPIETTRVLSEIALRSEAEITEPKLMTARKRLHRLLRAFGYDEAHVKFVLTDTDDPLRVTCTVVIVAGRARRISDRVFVVKPKYQELVRSIQENYSVTKNDRLDEDALIEADNQLVEELRGEGFLLATVNHRILRHKKRTLLYVYLEAGPQYRFRFSGNLRIDTSELTRALDLKADRDPAPQALQAKLESFYRDRGFYDIEIVTTKRMLKNGAIKELQFLVREGTAMLVKRRIFSCLPRDGPTSLRAASLTREINAVLEDNLPAMPLFGNIDEAIVNGVFGSNGSRIAKLRRLSPASTYTPAAYAKAVAHLEELLQAQGFLNSRVGPVSLRRAECDPTARAGRCDALPLPKLPPPRCSTNALGLPLPEPKLPPSHYCTPDRSRSIRCAPEVEVILPIQLGPQTRLYDVSFDGNKTISANKLLELSKLRLGGNFSSLELDAARQRIQDAYRDAGYAYATVRAEPRYSPDRTRARARFSINEHRPVTIQDYRVVGATRTSHKLILSRLALCQDLSACKGSARFYKRQLVRQSENQIATLGVFSSVSIGLEDPDIPQQRKHVVITVVEQLPQYIEPRGGFSTGEGVRAAFEYGHRNIAGRAISLTIRLELAYLPDFLIFDANVRENYGKFVSAVSERLERRNSISLRFPQIGLGPKVDFVLDGVDVRDNQRDFGLTRQALIPTLNYRPNKTLSFQLSASTELNDVTIFEGGIADAIRNNANLANLLRAPEGRTVAIAQRLAATWDRRDNAFAATRGTFLNAGIEHVSALPLDDTEITSEFLRFTWRGAGYLKLTDRGLALALSLGGGFNLQLKSASQTYPDRLFYMGGVNTLRGFQLNSVMPQDIADEVLDGKLAAEDVAVRGGDLFLNPRAELRIPLTSLLSTGLFLDTGNVWSRTDSIQSPSDLLRIRVAAGAGLRVTTPIGPIAFDGGFKLVRNDFEDIGAVHFAIGLF